MTANKAVKNELLQHLTVLEKAAWTSTSVKFFTTPG
jgi:hypothetical protein